MKAQDCCRYCVWGALSLNAFMLGAVLGSEAGKRDRVEKKVDEVAKKILNPKTEEYTKGISHGFRH